MFSNKTALVTGGSRGIGLAISRALHAEGAKVIVVGRKQKYLDDVERKLPGTQTVQVDLADWDATEKALSNIGPVDFLINNAAILNNDTIEKTSKVDIDLLLDVNIKSVINVTKCVLPGMQSKGSECAIVNVSSIASTVVTSTPVYAATKAALDHLTRHMAVEFGKYKIRVNAINPGVVLGTDIVNISDIKPDTMKEFANSLTLARDKTPTGSFAKKSHCADLVLFLLSDKSKSINGTCVDIDGGFRHSHL